MATSACPPFVVLFGLWEAFGINIPGPSNRDLPEWLGSARGEEFFRGAWGWFAVVVVQLVFNSVLGEELLFRGLLLPFPGKFARGKLESRPQATPAAG
jgi:CAAX protease family protein